MSQDSIPLQALAAGLAARLIHDVSGPASGVASGMDLHAETDLPDLRTEALDLAASSARALLDLLGFCQAAFGGAGEPRSAEDLQRLALTQFAGRRARLDWSLGVASLDGPASQALLILVQIAVGGLPVGGTARATARIQGGDTILRIEAEGPRAGLSPEVTEGLAGRLHPGGLPGRWAPACYLHSVIAAAGGELRWAAGAGSFTAEATLPS